MNDKTIAIYNAIVLFYARNGYMPTLREIGDVVGIASTGRVSYQVQKLETAGWLERSGGARAMVLTRITEAGLTPGDLREWIAEYNLKSGVYDE